MSLENSLAPCPPAPLAMSCPRTLLHPSSLALLATRDILAVFFFLFTIWSLKLRVVNQRGQLPVFLLSMKHLEPIVPWPLWVSCLEVKQHTLILHCKNVFPANILDFCVSVETPIYISCLGSPPPFFPPNGQTLTWQITTMFLKILLMLSKQQQLPLEIRNQLSVIGHKLLVADVLLRVTQRLQRPSA